MPELNNFIFSSHNMQEFLDCERRFELKYLLKQSWPAPQSEPVLEVEKRIRIGREFHFMIHQYLSGISLSDLLHMNIEPELKRWLGQFEAFYGNYSFIDHYSEHSITSPFMDYFLTAVYDFIGLAENSKLIIADWKTSHLPPRKERIEKTVQSFLYQYLAFENRQQLFGHTDIGFGDIEMIFWNSIHPNDIVTLPYSEKQHEKNQESLIQIIEKIISLPMGKFSKTDNLKKCAYCQYRSLCQRGIKAGLYDQDQDEVLEMDTLISEINFDESAEIPY